MKDDNYRIMTDKQMTITIKVKSEKEGEKKGEIRKDTNVKNHTRYMVKIWCGRGREKKKKISEQIL